MKKLLQILNVLSLLLAIWVNYHYNNGQNVAQSMKSISDKYENLLNPAGYAFSIWGLIYIMLFAFSIYQLRSLFSAKYEDDFILKIGPWFVVANLCNAAWVVAFCNDHIGWSVLIMLVLFFSLLKIVINLNMERWDAFFETIALVWWPFSLYSGWITIALIANLSIYFRSLGWDGEPLNPYIWAFLVLIVAGIIFITMIWLRNMREYATVGAWGIIAISVKNWQSNPAIAHFALAIAIIIVINCAIHGYRNRALGPIRSLRPKQKI